MCNNKLWKGGNTDEPTKLWEVGKQLGMTCCGNEEEVIKEFGRMEDRDKEIMKKSKEGSKHESL